MANTYRYIGAGETTIVAPATGATIRLNSFGQQIELSDDVATAAVLSNAPVIPEERFQGHGFTVEEIAKYGKPLHWRSAPDSFNGKVSAAWADIHNYKAEVAGRAVTS